MTFTCCKKRPARMLDAMHRERRVLRLLYCSLTQLCLVVRRLPNRKSVHDRHPTVTALSHVATCDTHGDMSCATCSDADTKHACLAEAAGSTAAPKPLLMNHCKSTALLNLHVNERSYLKSHCW